MRNVLLRRSVRHAGLVLVLILTLAGILLPASVSAAPAADAPARPAQGSYYTVQPGDTLSQIAKWYGTTVNAIMAANRLPSTRIYVGQVLFIPSGGGGGGGGACSQYYVVRRGDTLSQIARWYGVSLNALAQANGIYNPSRIYVGQRLCIPGGHPGPGPIPPGPVPPGPYCGQYYTVQRGDNLTRIAGWCGTTVRSLMHLNGIHNPNLIFVGQVLRTY